MIYIISLKKKMFFFFGYKCVPFGVYSSRNLADNRILIYELFWSKVQPSFNAIQCWKILIYDHRNICLSSYTSIPILNVVEYC